MNKDLRTRKGPSMPAMNRFRASRHCVVHNVYKTMGNVIEKKAVQTKTSSRISPRGDSTFMPPPNHRETAAMQTPSEHQTSAIPPPIFSPSNTHLGNLMAVWWWWWLGRGLVMVWLWLGCALVDLLWIGPRGNALATARLWLAGRLVVDWCLLGCALVDACLLFGKCFGVGLAGFVRGLLVD